MDGETPMGEQVNIFRVGGDMPAPEDNAYLPDFTPETVHLLLRGAYGDYPHHNDGLHLDRRIADAVIWQRHCRQIAAQSDNCYSTPSSAVLRFFTAILSAEWRGVIGRTWNSKSPLVSAHVVLTKTLGVRRAREIWARITRRMDL